MTTYISTYCADKILSLNEVLAKYLKGAILNVELTSGRGYTENLENLLSSYKFHYIVHNYFPDSKQPFVLNLSSNDIRVRQKSIDHIKSAINLSKKFNSNLYAFHGGFLYQPMNEVDVVSGLLKSDTNVRSIDKFGAFKTFVDNLKLILNYAKEQQIKILIENPPCPETHKGKLLFATADDYLTLFKLVENDNLGILLDLGHLKICAKTYSFSINDYMDKLKEKVFALHISDNDGMNDQNAPIEKDGWIVKLLTNYRLTHLPATLEIGNFDMNVILEQKELLEHL